MRQIMPSVSQASFKRAVIWVLLVPQSTGVTLATLAALAFGLFFVGIDAAAVAGIALVSLA
jgi:hypothetical protein